MSSTFRAHRSSYDGRVYLDINIDVNSDLPRVLFEKMSQTAIRRAADLMSYDNGGAAERQEALECVQIATNIEEMLETLTQIQKEDTDAQSQEE